MRRLFLQTLLLFFLTGLLFSCKREYSAERFSLPAKAEIALQDSLGRCYGVNISGTYFIDKDPSGDSNYAELRVNVLKAGTYTLSTVLQNGFLFADSGMFTSTGEQNVRLRIAGKPLRQERTTFQYSFDSVSCSFDIDVQKTVTVDTSTIPDLAINTWEFTDSTNNTYHAGTVIPNPPGVTAGPNGYYEYTLMGAVKPTVPYDSLLYINIKFPPPFIQTGSYSTGDHNYFSFVSYPGNLNLYVSDDFTGGKIIVDIIDVNQQAKYIKGRFHGFAHDQYGQDAKIVNGRFYANLFY